MPPAKKTDLVLRVVQFKSQGAWEAWLDGHFDSSPGLWLRLAKKSAKTPSVSYQQALDGALCYGWIDGQKKSYDADYWLQKFTARGPKSIWSKINRARAMELIQLGRMRPAGFAAIEAARERGRWEGAYDSYKTSVVPADFQAELDKHPQARAFFKTLNSANRYAILFRLQTAKREETRRRRTKQFLQMLERGEKLHP